MILLGLGMRLVLFFLKMDKYLCGSTNNITTNKMRGRRGHGAIWYINHLPMMLIEGWRENGIIQDMKTQICLVDVGSCKVLVQIHQEPMQTLIIEYEKC